jgi:hypothetical protein
VSDRLEWDNYFNANIIDQTGFIWDYKFPGICHKDSRKVPLVGEGTELRGMKRARLIGGET